MQQEFLD